MQYTSNSALFSVVNIIFLILPLFTKSQVFFGDERIRRPSSDAFFVSSENNGNKGSENNDVNIRNILGLENEKQDIVGRL